MVALRTLLVALTGVTLTAALVTIARRQEISQRLPSRGRPRVNVLPAGARVRLARALHDAALAAAPEQAVEIWLFGACTAAIIGFGLAPAVGVLAGSGVIFGAPVALHLAGQRQARIIAAAVPETLEQVGSELRSGGTVATALATIANGHGPLAPDIARLESRVGLGASLPDALEAWARERPAAGVEATAGALALSSSVGGRAADALDALASSLRDRLAVAAEARALSSQARYSAWVIGVAPLGYIVGSAAIDPRSLHALIGTGAGRACALAGIVLELLGAMWMRDIVRAGDWT
jgi:tight adherence protein B